MTGAAATPPPHPDVERLIERGHDAERQARHGEARSYFERALRGLGHGGSPGTAAELTRWIARTFIAESNFEAAEASLAASIEIALANRDLDGVASALNYRAIAAHHRGRLDEAIDTYTQARESAVAAGDRRLVAMIDNNLGAAEMIQGDAEAALGHFEAALATQRLEGDDYHAAETLNCLAMLYTDLERWDEAETTFGEALRTAEASGNVSTQLMIEVNRAELGILRGLYEEGRAACDRALELATTVHDTRALAEIHKHYGVIYRETGNPRIAETHLDEAARLAEQREDLLLAAETAREQAELFWRQQRHRETLQSLNRAHRLFTQLRAQRDLLDVNKRHAQLEHTYLEIVRRWSTSIESADRYTQGHCERVANYACALAREVGMDDHTLFWFRMGALLHDVGKIVVPSEILNKAGPLTEEERAAMERHAEAGVELLADVDFPWDIRGMVRHHHERWTGGGYPHGIAGEEIPLAARILCIADVYDALSTDRPYRSGFSAAQSLEIMHGEMAGHFDPELFGMFRRLHETGSFAAASRNGAAAHA